MITILIFLIFRLCRSLRQLVHLSPINVIEINFYLLILRDVLPRIEKKIRELIMRRIWDRERNRRGDVKK